MGSPEAATYGSAPEPCFIFDSDAKRSTHEVQRSIAVVEGVPMLILERCAIAALIILAVLTAFPAVNQ